ncbi:membrane protein insertase YidC [Phyllobacterium sp. TAF24]|uniref:membrane protein insertase YidC n=1 Tax=Phyllobacterium sp. TAF24 TaxID=3233068 RepID=UPI003F970F9A
METNRNFFITIALSVVILGLWQVFYMGPKIEAERQQAQVEASRQAQAAKTAAQPTPAAGTTANNLPGTTPAAPGANIPGQTPDATQPGSLSRAAVLGQTSRVVIDTPSLSGSISLTGARLDDLQLKQYHETVDNNSPTIQLLSPSQMADGQFVEIGFTGNDTTGTVPGPTTVWTVDGNNKLTPSTPVTLAFTNEKGLTFKRTFSVDDNYMFTVKDAVTNGTSAPVSLASYGRVTRFYKPLHASTYVLHEGPIGVIAGKLVEYKFAAIEKEKEVAPEKTDTGGWIGITDKYWAAALVPAQSKPFKARMSYFDNGRPQYQSDYLSDPTTIEPGQSTTIENLVFAGAKEVGKINGYMNNLHIPLFKNLIDWGWFYFITEPMFYLIDWLYKAIGNFGVAILVVTVLLKALFFPLANKSYASMARMKMVQPKMTEIREKYADDKVKQQQAMMELYKTEKINPIAGCWPIVIQIPVFFALYKVLYVTIEMRHAPFFGWIQDLAAPDPTSVFNLFGLIPWTVPAFLMIGVWPLIMGVTMFLQMRMNPTPPDPTQAMIFNWMPLIFTFMLSSFPAGLVIYWAWNNFLSITQQGIIMKRQGAKIELWGNLAGLFKKKPKPAE